MAYQHKVEKLLRKTEGFEDVQVGKWIEFYDGNGGGYAQPDAFVVGPFSTIVFEVKLKETTWGHNQVEHLYRPLLHGIYRRPVVCVLVCKFISFPPESLIANPQALLDETDERTHIWHWLG